MGNADLVSIIDEPHAESLRAKEVGARKLRRSREFRSWDSSPDEKPNPIEMVQQISRQLITQNLIDHPMQQQVIHRRHQSQPNLVAELLFPLT